MLFFNCQSQQSTAVRSHPHTQLPKQAETSYSHAPFSSVWRCKVTTFFSIMQEFARFFCSESDFSPKKLAFSAKRPAFFIQSPLFPPPQCSHRNFGKISPQKPQKICCTSLDELRTGSEQALDKLPLANFARFSILERPKSPLSVPENHNKTPKKHKNAPKITQNSTFLMKKFG